MSVDIPSLVLLTEAKGMPLERLIQAIEAAVLTAYTETPEPNRYARVQMDRETGVINIYVPTFNELGERIRRKRLVSDQIELGRRHPIIRCADRAGLEQAQRFIAVVGVE